MDCVLHDNLQDLWKRTHNTFYAKYRNEHYPKLNDTNLADNTLAADLTSECVMLRARAIGVAIGGLDVGLFC